MKIKPESCKYLWGLSERRLSLYFPVGTGTPTRLPDVPVGCVRLIREIGFICDDERIGSFTDVRLRIGVSGDERVVLQGHGKQRSMRLAAFELLNSGEPHEIVVRVGAALEVYLLVNEGMQVL